MEPADQRCVDKNARSVAEISDQDKFDQASAEIDRQRSRIAEIRTNAGIVIAATSLVGSFLGSRVIDLNNGSHGVSDVALALLPVGLFLTSRALWPLRDATAKGHAAACIGKVSTGLRDLSGTQLVWRHSLSPEDLRTSDLSQAGEKLRGYATDNQKLLDRRASALMAAIVVLMLQAILWSAALMGM